jgi:AcrR family transcriptional regulator
MRITAKAKDATRNRILKTAANLFIGEGWHNTTTRGIAAGAGIANGTLFNYFPTKEAIAAALFSEAMQSVGDEFSGTNGDASLEAALFTLIWTDLLNLRGYRKFLAPAIETIFSPLARSSPGSPGDALRIGHLERVDAILAAHGIPAPRPAISVQLYWTLYLGVLSFWAADESPGQEDTLALLDQSLRLYAATLNPQYERKPDERK